MKLIIRVLILILGVALFSFSSDGDVIIDPAEDTTSLKTETFEFSSNGMPIKGKIYLPAAYETNRNLPAIYLIDFTEQQYKIATDEYISLINMINEVQYPWLQFESLEYTNSNYENTYPVSFAEGIKYVFNK